MVCNASMRFEAKDATAEQVLSAAAIPPDPTLYAAMLHAPTLNAVMANTLGDLIDSIAVLDRMQASLSALKAELIEQARQWSVVVEQSVDGTASTSQGGWNAEVRARRVIASELACALRIPERTAETLVAQSTALTELPETFRALSAGTISWRHASTIIEHTSSLPAESWGTFETATVPLAEVLTVAKFDRGARVLRERLCPESIDVRNRDAAAQRNLSIEPARDGMAVLSAYLPAALAHGVFNRTIDMAPAQQSPTEDHTLTQLKVDLFAELLLDGRLESGRDRGIRPRVLVTVPVLTMLGAGDEPGVLEGYGTIDHETAFALAVDAPSFIRLLTHPETGAVLSVGRDRYSVPSDMRTWLRVQDGTCRFPGCSRSARVCDLDHTEEWQHHGKTSHDNLAHLCKTHHHLKHHTAWTVKQSAGGVLNWTSPSGRRYSTEPATRTAPVT